jgi:hypothetical protein
VCPFNPYLYKIKLKRVIITANHDRLKLCQDREVPEWAQKLSQQIIEGTGYTKEKGASKINGGIEISFIVFVGNVYWGVHDQVRGVQRMVSW